MTTRTTPQHPDERAAKLAATRQLKMAESFHRYVRGSTLQFYEWLDSLPVSHLPDGPPIWICGDCHLGNLGPVPDRKGKIDIHIRDFDQTTVSNPVYDLLRLALSLAAAAISADLPGATAPLMLEAMMEGYEQAFAADFDEDSDLPMPQSVQQARRQSVAAAWQSLSDKHQGSRRLATPGSKKFWPLSPEETQAIEGLLHSGALAPLIARLKGDDAPENTRLLDAAYWQKGCSSLGQLRYAALLQTGKKDYLMLDFKEAAASFAPTADAAEFPDNPAERIVTGTRHLTPYLGKRMQAVSLNSRSVYVRELLPEDLKLDIRLLTQSEAVRAAAYLSAVVGKAHSRQMDEHTRRHWLAELARNRTRQLDAPTWLWNAVCQLLPVHLEAYLLHCRRYALSA